MNDIKEHSSFDETYFHTHTYENVSFSRFSQYWWSNRFYAALVRRHGRKEGKFLEVGCGLGHLVAQLETDFETYAIDVNPWAIKEAKNVTHSTALQVASAVDLPFSDHVFDVVVIKHIVEHLPNPDVAIIELARVLKSGGLLILSTPNMSSFLKPLKGNTWIGYQDPTHISLKPPEEWLDLLRGEGFRLQRVFSDGFWDTPYIPFMPASFQKLIFGSLGGFQAITTWVFLPMRWGESIIVLAFNS